MSEVEKIELAMALLDEARGFAAMSPSGRDNINEVYDMLPDLIEQAYRRGFVDGESHGVECNDMIFDKTYDEAIRQMNNPRILGFDSENMPIENDEHLPNSDTQIGVEFAIDFIRTAMKVKK